MCDEADVATAKPLVEALRNERDYPRMLRLAEAVRRLDPGDAKNRRLLAQALIESGLATVAVDVLRALTDSLGAAHPERAEAQGLLGRAWKQIFFDTADKSAPAAQCALTAAIDVYREPYEFDEGNTWHGVNLLALVHRARRMGLAVAPDLQLKPLARKLVATLEARPLALRDEWFLPTLAEASLGLGDWDVVERRVHEYVASPDAKAFLVASTLRQFSEVWDLERGDDPRGRSLVALLRSRLLALPSAQIELSPGRVRELQTVETPSAAQLEAVLGKDGPQTYEWWLTGLKRARSVAAVKRRFGRRVGTGFLVRAGDLGMDPPDELMVLTNYHVVNQSGQSPGIPPGEAQVVFEAAEGSPVFDVKDIVWSAPPDRQDASLLRLQSPVTNIEPMPISGRLPDWPPPEGGARAPRVYVIGHPGGRDLSFSFQDNELLGHEGPPSGKPPVEGVCRVHYRAPTEGGSSGSPVFNDNAWAVIALHHMGGELGMPHLNGEAGSYAANEGISMQSIAEAISQSRQGSA
ncbi:serine protease [Variovorax sp. J22R115]|uniref:serine protease n=1 Tax=Variovorax sp. J22R115 TaxID=3053509 RepID=UPI002576B295|nr:trypsin-like peptidase domain-containing protein [Variovorax sp. J22R115]MDM0047945.1 trypsin-like peptidase domain-containing protein [Variovorax sp. J22R115]